jgi:hypothetical protein
MSAEMDLYKVIQELYVEKEKLQRIIVSLEDLLGLVGRNIPPISKSGKRRGRKSMSDDERQIVSVRMKNYWSVRRHVEHAHAGLS